MGTWCSIDTDGRRTLVLFFADVIAHQRNEPLKGPDLIVTAIPLVFSLSDGDVSVHEVMLYYCYRCLVLHLDEPEM